MVFYSDIVLRWGRFCLFLYSFLTCFSIVKRLSGEVNTSPCESESTSESPPSLLQDATLPALLVSGATTLFQNTTTPANNLSLNSVDGLSLPNSSEVESCNLANGCATSSSLAGLALPLTSSGGLCSTTSSSAVAWLMNEDSTGKY